MKSSINKAEQKLADIYKGAPKLSESAKESLAKAWPWIALVFGVLQLLAAWGLYGIIRATERLVEITNVYSQIYSNTASPISSSDRTLIYLGVVILAVDGLILLLAYQPLKARKRKGWDLLFLAALINLAYGVLAIFIAGRGFGGLLSSLVGSAVAFYLLFQVQNKFAKK